MRVRINDHQDAVDEHAGPVPLVKLNQFFLFRLVSPPPYYIPSCIYKLYIEQELVAYTRLISNLVFYLNTAATKLTCISHSHQLGHTDKRIRIDEHYAYIYAHDGLIYAALHNNN